MRWRRAPKPERVPGEYPESFVRGWMARTLPSATPTEAGSAVRHLRSKGWTEEKLAEFILPYMPRDVPQPPALGARPERTPAPGAPAADAGAPAPRPQTEPVPPVGTQPEPARPIPLPPDVTRAWLDEHLPAMDRRQMRLAVDELERRGWPLGTVAMAVLPHLLPKLPAEDGRAIVDGLADLGMTAEEITRATKPV